MAIYHCSVKTHSRSDTSANHAVRSAAYRAGTELVCEDSGTIYNYSYKSEVTYSEITLPANAPEWAGSRTLLWNNVEKSEARKDAQLFREVEVAIPHELTDEQNQELLREYSRIFTKDGMIVDWSIHGLAHNKHCHMMLTLRQLLDGKFGNKNREWNDKKKLENWRKVWGDLVNKHLAKAGYDITVDHRSYEKQGIDVIPTVHEGREGVGGHNAEMVNHRRQRNRKTRADNIIRSELKNAEGKAVEVNARIKEIDQKIAELQKHEPIIQESTPDVKLSVGNIVLPKLGKTISQVLEEFEHATLPKPNPIYQVRPATVAPISRNYSLASADLLQKSHQVLFGARPEPSNKLKAPKISALLEYCIDLRLPNGKIIRPENHDALKQTIEAWSLNPTQAKKLEAEFWKLSTYEYYNYGIRGILKRNTPKIDPSVLDCFTKEELTYFKAKGVSPKSIIEYALQRVEYGGITKSVTIDHRGIKETINSCNDFYATLKNESVAECNRLNGQYWKLIDLKSYCLQLFDAGFLLGFKPNNYDPLTIIICHERSISPKNHVSAIFNASQNTKIPTPPVIHRILSSNSSIRDYADILSYAGKRDLTKGDFDKLLVPWWNQFKYDDYFEEVRRLAIENGLFLRFEKVTESILNNGFYAGNNR